MKIIERLYIRYTVYGYINEYGSFIWHNINDLPAVIWDNGSLVWYNHDEIHRELGAAYIRSSGSKEYWLNGIDYPGIKTDEEWIIKQILE